MSSNIRSLVRPVEPRDPHEPHRASTPLELLFDLVLVIAVAAAAAGLHHAFNENHVAEGVLVYLFVFWTLWWPWMNFTWYASAYDNDDVIYRLLVLVQMVGALVTAVAVREVSAGSITALALVGYIIMRIAMIAQWARAARFDGPGRQCAKRYALGITFCQVLWVLYYFFAPRETFIIGALPLIALEMFVPTWAERASPTPWHRHHIAERYGLLTIIVLGESLTAGAAAIAAIAADRTGSIELWMTLISCFVILFAMWWIYFGERQHNALDKLNTAIIWGYSHYFVFVSIAAVGAGISVLVDQLSHKSEISYNLACAAVSVPVAVYLMSVWFVHDRNSTGIGRWQLPLFAGLVLLTTPLPYTAELIAVLLTVCLAMRIREDAAAAE